jgi:hypothetical protein
MLLIVLLGSDWKNLSTNGISPLFPQAYVISTRRRRLLVELQSAVAFPSPCGFLTTFPAPSPKPNPTSHLAPTNYSFKVVFRDFRDFHSVPVKHEICSNWNIQHNVPAGTLAPWRTIHSVP